MLVYRSAGKLHCLCETYF